MCQELLETGVGNKATLTNVTPDGISPQNGLVAGPSGVFFNAYNHATGYLKYYYFDGTSALMLDPHNGANDQITSQKSVVIGTSAYFTDLLLK